MDTHGPWRAALASLAGWPLLSRRSRGKSAQRQATGGPGNGECALAAGAAVTVAC